MYALNKTASSCKLTFNIAGAFSQFKNIAMFFTKYPNLLKKYNYTVYDGINMCNWNGGRINREIYWEQGQIDYYYKHNINIALTFSNHIIDLDNTVGNELLKKFHRRNNKIILVNDKLREYIRINYPKYKLVHSITDTGDLSPIYEKCIDYYKDLETKYDYIVPKMEHVMHLDYRLNLSKYEILINDSCVYNCSLYNQHFKKINEQNLLNNPQKELSVKDRECIEECWIKTFNSDIGDQKYYQKVGLMKGMDLNKEQINILLSKGILHFKISGREMTPEMFREQLNIL